VGVNDVSYFNIYLIPRPILYQASKIISFSLFTYYHFQSRLPFYPTYFSSYEDPPSTGMTLALHQRPKTGRHALVKEKKERLRIENAVRNITSKRDGDLERCYLDFTMDIQPQARIEWTTLARSIEVCFAAELWRWPTNDIPRHPTTRPSADSYCAVCSWPCT